MVRRKDELAFPLVGLERGYFLDVQHFFGERKLIGFKVLCSPCNLNCYYCHRSPFLNRNIRRIPLSKVLEEMEKWEPYNIVTFTGGEITLVAEPTAELMDQLRSRGITTLFSTNGVLTEQVDFLTDHADLMKIDVKASIHQYGRVSGIDAYDRVLRSVAIGVSKLNTEVKVLLHSFTEQEDVLSVMKDLHDVTGLPENMIVEFQLIKDFLNRGICEPDFEKMKRICRAIQPLRATILLKYYGDEEVILKLIGGEWGVYRKKEIPLRFNW